MTKLKHWKLSSVKARHGWMFICFDTDVRRLPAGTSVCLGLWGDILFQCDACKNFFAFFSIGHEAACPITAFYLTTLSRYVFLIQYLARRAVRASSSGHCSCCIQSLCAPVLVGVQQTADKFSIVSCRTVSPLCDV